MGKAGVCWKGRCLLLNGRIDDTLEKYEGLAAPALIALARLS